MRAQQGVHPRIGAVDVVPFIPLKKCRHGRCRRDARRFGRAFAEKKLVPVYFYGEAALVEDRQGAAPNPQGATRLSKNG